MEENKKNILVAPLNWGLGHATRCIPIIRALIAANFNPIIASDGYALEMLKKEFPALKTLELPSYEIEYAKNGKNFKWKMLFNSPKMISAILKEKKIVRKWVAEYQLSGIISDNRLGVRSKKVPAVFITHQLHVLSGNTSWFTTKVHLKIIKKFSECWVPDFENKPNLTGKLGHINPAKLKPKYLGPLSRLEKRELPKKYDLMVLLSGPEPQRTLLEEILRIEVLQFNGKVLFVNGVVESTQKTNESKHVTYYNYMDSAQLEVAFNESALVLCRSGYTTIMDLAKLEKKAFLIPTPGQYEQEYLAKKLKKDGLFPYCKQEKFHIGKLNQVLIYKGIKDCNVTVDWDDFFKIFESR